MSERTVKDFRQAIILLMAEYPDLTKYRLAKDLDMSTSTIINNVLMGVTHRPNIKFIRNLKEVYDITIEGEVYETTDDTGTDTTDEN